MATAAAPPDADGWCSLSLHAGAPRRRAAAGGSGPRAAARRRGLAALPAHLRAAARRTGTRCHVDEIDLLVESDAAPFPLADPRADRRRSRDRRARARLRPRRRDAADRASARSPPRIAGLLAEGDGGDYGVHSEMFTTGLMRLHEAGKVTQPQGPVRRRLGRHVRRRHRGALRLAATATRTSPSCPVDVVNSPELIARNRRMVTINGALAVDIHGQVVADTIDGIAVLGHRRPRGLRLRPGALARGPLAALPAVDGDGRAARRSRGSSPGSRRAR